MKLTFIRQGTKIEELTWWVKVSNPRNKKVKNRNKQCKSIQENFGVRQQVMRHLLYLLWSCSNTQFTPLILKYCSLRLMLFMSTVSTGTQTQVTELQNNYHWPRCADAQQTLQALQHCSLLWSNKEIERYAVMTYFGHLMDPRGSSQHPKLS